jgi:hypothetical protein
LALLLLGDSVAAAEPTPPAAGPQYDAVSLRKARGAAMSPELRLEFEVRQGDAAPARFIVWLAADYLDVRAAGRETIYDFRLHRRLVIDRDDGAFANLSLFADVAFRRFEMEKRVALAQAFLEASHGAPPPLPLQPFWIESDVGVSSETKVPPAIETEVLGDGAQRFRFDGEEVAFFVAASEAVPGAMRATFARFLRLHLPLHPDIVAAIAENGHLPQRLVYVTVKGGERRTAGLILRKSLMLRSDYPLAAALARRPLANLADDKEGRDLAALLPTMLQAVAGKALGGPRPLADFRRAIDAALRGEESFEAALLLAEATMQYGRAANDCEAGTADLCHDAAELSRRLGADRRAALLYKGQQAEAEDPEEAATLWQGLKHDDVADGFVVDALLAPLLSGSRHRADAVAAFAKALAGNPYVGPLYRELGDHYLRAARPDLAWLCYDLGRALPNRSPDGRLSEVDALERKLEAQYPGLF